MNRRPMFWILRNRKPIPADNFVAWAIFHEDQQRRRVAFDIVEHTEHDKVSVSTVFVGMAQYGTGTGPVLFESMVFGGPLDQQTYRYSTWDEASAGHKILTAEVALEAKVIAWEVRERLKALAERSKESTR